MPQTPSLQAQAAAVARVARRECVKPLRPRGSEEELLIEHLRAAAATLERLVLVERGKRA